MMMVRLAALVLTLPAAFILSSAPVAAAEAKKPEPACAADSPKMTIGEVIALGDAAIGRCVTVEGWALGFYLQADNEARYRQQRVYNDYSTTGAVLGLYGRNRGADPGIIRATGRIDSCKAVYDRIIAAGEIPFLGGFCHYYHGYVINAGQVDEIGKPDIVRIPAGAARAELGNLSPMAAGAARDALQAAFAPLLAALQTRDEAALKQLLRVESGVPLPDDKLAQRVAALTGPGAATEILPRDTAASVEIFGWREPGWADAGTRAGNAADAAKLVSGIACAAPPATAERRLWPIADADAGFAPGRPYICARVSLPSGEPPRYTIYPEERAIREPA